MFNNSVTQLRQITIANISLSKHPNERSVSSSSPQFCPSRSSFSSNVPDEDVTAFRPPKLRRRSTRNNQSIEAAATRYQRLESAIDDHHFETFFILCASGDLVYISEIVSGISPVFLPFQLDCRARTVQVVVYTRPCDRRWRKLLSQEIRLAQVREVAVAPTTNVQNVVFMQFEDESWYHTHSPEQRTLVTNDYPRPRANSYSLGQVLRLQSSAEYVNDTIQSVIFLKKEMESILDHSETQLRARSDLSFEKTRLSDISRTCRALASDNAAHRARALALRSSISLRRSLLDSSRNELATTEVTLKQAHDKQRLREPALQLLSSEIRRLQRQITTVLAAIYPITNTSSGNRIRGLKTAVASDYVSENHEESAALGYVAHLVFLLAHYLSIPLRYPIRPLSSHSFVLDPISIMPNSSDIKGGPPYSIKRDRQYPLFFERGGLQRLQWGVFLLNKNIEQILQARGLVCGDIRDALQNLGGLVVWLMSVNEDEDVTLSTPTTSRVIHTNLIAQTGMKDDREVSDPGDGARLLGALEITDHDDLLAAQLRSQMRKGKTRMARFSEKSEEQESHSSSSKS